MTLRDLELKRLYHGVDAAREDFLIPAIKESSEYWRGSGYFSVSSMIATSEGLESLAMRGGIFKLLIGLHDVPQEFIEAQGIVETWNLENFKTRKIKEFISEIESLQDALLINKIETIAIALRDGFLKVKLASPANLNSVGIFHIKRIILRDSLDNYVVATGSPNETMAGLSLNFEDLTVFNSWDSSAEYAKIHIETFEAMWNGQDKDLHVQELTSDLVARILQAVNIAKSRQDGLPDECNEKSISSFINAARNSIGYYPLRYGNFQLLPHQEYAYIKGLSRWPIRVLLGDEVGLGKTIEMGSILDYLVKSKKVESVLILAPKSLIVQLQDELLEKFGLNFARWDSSRKVFVDSYKCEISGDEKSPGSKNAPKMMIVSAQWARGSRTKGHLFESMEHMPDLLIVDEAHSARKPPKDSNQGPTLMFKMLKEATSRIPHVLLLTATPMQIHIEEFLGLLELLGAPQEWVKESNFMKSLELLVSSENRIPLDTAKTLLNLILASKFMLNEDSQDLQLLNSIIGEVSGNETSIEQISHLRSNWNQLRSLFIDLNPAHNLTVRNTRSSLERMGYEFPQRVFKSPALAMSPKMKEFQDKMEDYLRNAYGSVEKAINPRHENSLGFVLSVYQQRMTSSLWAASKSLKRRQHVISQYLDGVVPEAELNDEDLLDEIEFIEEPELLKLASDSKFRVTNAALRESAYINELVDVLNKIENGLVFGDPKIEAATEFLASLKGKSKAIVFSRYTDTLESLLISFDAKNANQGQVCYGYFTGSDSWVTKPDGEKVNVTKKELRQSLERGDISIIFCSDAASEGLNLQSASLLMNIDVPWNPGRLEQRIGRIARLGQKAKEVEIQNYWYPGSVESQMYTRLFQRRELYELAVGAFPQIFSAAIRNAVVSNLKASAVDTQDPIQELEEIRESSHRKSLEYLWGSEKLEDAKTQVMIREIASVITDIKKNNQNLESLDEGFEGSVLSNPVFDEVKVMPKAGENWSELFWIHESGVGLCFAIQRDNQYIPIPLEDIANLLRAVLGQSRLEIKNHWHEFAFGVSDSINLPEVFFESFSFYPKHRNLNTIKDFELSPLGYKESANGNLEIVPIGSVWLNS